MIARGTRVTSKTALAALLREWLRASREPTIGAARGFGRTPWIDIDLPRGHAVLNADTRRAAVDEYLDDVARRGAEVSWRVVANSRGRINKVMYTPAGHLLPGWYCYLVFDIAAEGEL
jgi:hypothetical protein